MIGTDNIKDWIRTLPSTNYRIFISIWLSVLVVLAFTIAIIQGRDVAWEGMVAIFSFLGVMLGLDYKQYVKKRESFKPGSPDDQSAMVDDGLTSKTTTEQRTTTVQVAPPPAPAVPSTTAASVPGSGD